VLAVAIIHAVAFIAGIITRRAVPGSSAADVLTLVAALSAGGVALGFMAGLSSWRLFENRGLRRFASSFAAHPPAIDLRETSDILAEAMDPSLEVIQRPGEEPDGWVDLDGRPCELSSNDRRCMTEIASNGRVVGVFHDAAFRHAPAFLDIARSSILKALENERLGTELRDSLRELKESRARIVSGADRERQRIERDLHDGAQQTLVALRIRLELAGQLLAESPARAEKVLSDLATEVDEALDEVRSLARGVYPSLLGDRGLPEALHAAALRNPVRTTVATDGVGRYSPEIEAATYFCCLEAMQNAMKHAGGVEAISVTLDVKEDLRFEVRDDGAGFVETELTTGAGVTNMRDRLAAVGGRLRIRASLGNGTSVSGVVPLASNGSSGLNGRLPQHE
jgi:signal transduction histidine kinase